MEKKRVVYTPVGEVCSNLMIVDAVGDVISQVQIVGGCHGNGQGICALLKGMSVGEAIRRMEGIDCRGRGTSCPDQLAQALKKYSEG